MAETPKQPADGKSTRARLVAALVAAALLLVGLRVLSGDDEPVAPGDHAWDVELTISAEAEEGVTRVAVAVPLATRYLRTVGQTVTHPGGRTLASVRDEPRGSRRITLLATHSGRLSAQLGFNVHQSATPRVLLNPAGTRLDAEQREGYLRDHALLQIEDHGLLRLVDELAAESGDGGDLAGAIFDVVTRLREHAGDVVRSVPEVLAERRASRRERAYTMVALCRAARLPARLVRGFVLREVERAAPHYWVEVYQQDSWVPYDPVFGHRAEIPAGHLPVVKGLHDMVEISGSSSFTIDYAISNADLLMDLPTVDEQRWYQVLDLTRLPLDTRLVLASLLLLPLGVLLTTLFSEVVGLRFYGVFTPALLALSLSFVPWQSAAVVLAVVLVLGVIGRAAAPGGLTRAARLAIVFTLVALSLGVSASLMDYLGSGFGDQLVLLPIVVLAALVDRFYAVLDEKGLHTALYRLAWTVALAALCIPLIGYEALGHLLVRYPELHLLTLAGILALTAYRGRRLTQLPGLRWLDAG